MGISRNDLVSGRDFCPWLRHKFRLPARYVLPNGEKNTNAKMLVSCPRLYSAQNVSRHHTPRVSLDPRAHEKDNARTYNSSHNLFTEIREARQSVVNESRLSNESVEEQG